MVLALVFAAATVAVFMPVFSQGFLYGISALALAVITLNRFGRAAALHLLRRMRVA
jgi:hypothetical protein